jgi:hypothetical protein
MAMPRYSVRVAMTPAKSAGGVDVVQHLLVVSLLLDLAEGAVVAGNLPAVRVEPGDVLVAVEDRERGLVDAAWLQPVAPYPWPLALEADLFG